MLPMRNNSWMFPVWSPAGDPPSDPAPTGELSYADDDPAPADPAADLSVADPAAPVADPAADPADPADDADAAKAARQAELDAMSPEDRAKAEADDAAKEAEEAKLDSIPEDGKYEIKMPDGVEVDQALLGELGPEFASLGLSNRDAQKLADKFIATTQARLAKQAEDWAATTQGWVDTAKKDPEIGGAKWDASAASAAGVVERFGSDGLREYLNASGAGNHPELIRLLAKVGAAIGEDDPAISENPGAKPATAVEALYPDDKPKGK